MAAATLEQVDPNFPEDLEESKAAVWRAARWLSDRGNHVTVRHTRLREKIEERGEFRALGDLDILQRVEVKGRGLDFTSLEDFPFPTIIVCTVHSWDRAEPKPHAYLMVNREMTHLGVVLGSTSKHWKQRTVFDRRRGREIANYECPIEFVDFLPMPKPTE